MSDTMKLAAEAPALDIEGQSRRPSEQDVEGGASSHLVPLAGGPFGLWPIACVRGAGFPAQTILSLAAPGTAAMLDRVLDAEGAAPAKSVIHADLQRSFEVETARVSEALRAAVQDDRFREAVVWQNRRALHTGLDGLLRKPPGHRDKKTRQREALVASYLQRYCVKNDSIGFFGPIGWCRIGRGPEAMTARPGPGLLAARKVYFESWAIDAIASRLSSDPELRPFAAPRLFPYIRVDGGALQVPTVGAMPLTPAQAAVLEGCDGVTTARALARRLTSDPSLGLGGEAEVFEILDRACAMGVMAWDFEVALQLSPEEALRRALAGIEDPALRERARLPLDELERARDEVAAAAGDSRALDAAMTRLEDTFHRLTGAATTRSDGEMYAARTLVYEDCRRDLDLEIGAPLLRKLAPPLSLLLLSGRWVTYEVGRRYVGVLRDLFERLSAQQGGGPVELTVFHKALAEIEPWMREMRGMPEWVGQVQHELQRRWAEILQVPAGARSVERDPAALLADVRRAFDVPRPGWARARYMCPDLMIAARDVEALRRGECELVMGEMHLTHTLTASCFAFQHPSMRELIDLWELDNPAPSVIPVLPKAQWCQRINEIALGSGDLRYAFSREPSPAPAARTLRVADLVVVDHDGALEVHARGGGYRGGLLDFMGMMLSSMVTNALDVLPAEDHTPRLKIGDLVVARERWRFVASQVTFAREEEPLARWLAARRWKRAHGLPRFIFLKSPFEAKPYYADLDSPIFVDTIAKILRRASELDASAKVSVAEMLPSIDDLWLTDADGKRYTCELRLVTFDAKGL
ncbi:lantibiotic dehydratase [Sorangium cellulosum]|uniref:lantibiotic dehydratase n=1 Tax=Sorangium cellulosum TaxID=56 RepID=UPI000676FF80|nr:lantibiotic dehydratase [Sorangium cellulosum]